MNWFFLLIAIFVLVLVARAGMTSVTVYPKSSCSTFERATAAILRLPDLGTIGASDRIEYCKIPAFRIKTGGSESTDWVQAGHKIGCNFAAANQGLLTKDGVKIAL